MKSTKSIVDVAREMLAWAPQLPEASLNQVGVALHEVEISALEEWRRSKDARNRAGLDGGVPGQIYGVIKEAITNSRDVIVMEYSRHPNECPIGHSRVFMYSLNKALAEHGTKIFKETIRPSMFASEVSFDVNNSARSVKEMLSERLQDSIWEAEAKLVPVGIPPDVVAEVEVAASDPGVLIMQDVVEPAAPNAQEPSVIPPEENGTAIDRKLLLEAYKNECKLAGIRVTDEMIARAANPRWNERTPVKRWKSYIPSCTAADDAMIRRVLKEKPHLQSK